MDDCVVLLFANGSLTFCIRSIPFYLVHRNHLARIVSFTYFWLKFLMALVVYIIHFLMVTVAVKVVGKAIQFISNWKTALRPFYSYFTFNLGMSCVEIRAASSIDVQCNMKVLLQVKINYCQLASPIKPHPSFYDLATVRFLSGSTYGLLP